MNQTGPRGRRALQRVFDAAADGYDQAAVLQQEINRRLLERLELIRLQPERILDLGAATGDGSLLLLKRYRKARVIALDLSVAMLRHARRRGRWHRPLPSVCADAAALPLADGSVDLVYSSAMLHWCGETEAVLAEAQRVLRPGGLLMFSTWGPDTLRELRESWRAVDDRDHVNHFIDMHDIGDALVRAAFADPVMDMEHLTLTYDSVGGLVRDLRAMGGSHVLGRRRTGLLGRDGRRRLEAAYEAYRQEDGRLPATWEVVYGHAWATDRLVQERDDSGAVSVALEDFRRGLRRGR
ncbi:MAG: malonyl-ACP O-methyltransferase BioC [Ectothiorhodospiraceae bacterium]|nr:malonyl-ACP O-methyltransferase BioC [Ectothiorhodospiraceae bacterium]